MAAIFVLAGGIIGFFSAVLLVLMTGGGLLAALGIWTTAGLLSLLLGLLLTPASRAPSTGQPVGTAPARPQGAS